MIVEALGFGSTLALANAAHCAGMCGAFAIQAATVARRGAYGSLIAYTGGKTLTYTFLGALSAWLGRRAAEALPYLPQSLGLLTGVLLIGSGLRLLLGARTHRSLLPKPWTSAVGWMVSHARGYGPFALGAATGALPCGVTAIALLESSRHGDPLRAVLVMGSMGIGTAPILWVVGIWGRRLSHTLGGVGPRTLGGAILIAAGLWALTRTVLPLLLGHGDPSTCCH